MRKHWPEYFILGADHELISVDLLEWGRWLEHADRHVAWTGNDDLFVSTVFLGLDHRWFGDGPPLIFETMVFRNGEGDELMRYPSWKAAEAGHKRMCAKVFRKIKA